MFNVVQGDKVAVDRLLEHPDIKAISFVGSTPVAKAIYEAGTRNGKRVQALGGAKNHMVVLPDADIDMAADAAVSAAFGSAGRTLHGDLGGGGGGRRGGSADRRHQQAMAEDQDWAGVGGGQRDGAADHARASRSRGIVPRCGECRGRDGRSGWTRTMRLRSAPDFSWAPR